MRNAFEIFRRNRTVILSVILIVILPSVLLAVLGFRAIRSDSAQQAFQIRQRQQQIAVLLEHDLKRWLFSQQPDAAVSVSLLKFTIDGDKIVFPDHGLVIPSERFVTPVPFASSKGNPRNEDAPPDTAALDVQTIEGIYYPRIQAFLRDFKLSRSVGAQYFRRLKALIVQIPGTPSGYVLGHSSLIEHANRTLDELTASESFRAELAIAETGEPASAGNEMVSLKDFGFFQVVFAGREMRGDFRGNILVYASVLLIVATVLGIVFMYRALSHDMAVAQLKADFVSAVSHEFRTPLSSMLALLERLESGHVSDKEMQQRYHQTLRQEARRLGLLTDKLLGFAQLEEGRKNFSFERVNLQEITDEATRLFQDSNFSGRVRRIQPDSMNDAEVLVDRDAVIQCIQNVVENALKYSTPGTEVIVRCGIENETPFVEVVDQGIGIASGDRERIFEKFYRGVNAKTLNVQGTGIGLSVVKRIMEAHSGTVLVNSVLGKGSSFRLVFATLRGAA